MREYSQSGANAKRSQNDVLQDLLPASKAILAQACGGNGDDTDAGDNWCSCRCTESCSQILRSVSLPW